MSGHAAPGHQQPPTTTMFGCTMDEAPQMGSLISFLQEDFLPAEMPASQPPPVDWGAPGGQYVDDSSVRIPGFMAASTALDVLNTDQHNLPFLQSQPHHGTESGVAQHQHQKQQQIQEQFDQFTRDQTESMLDAPEAMQTSPYGLLPKAHDDQAETENSRKRKSTSPTLGVCIDDIPSVSDMDDNGRKYARQNHSEVEKRRRDKMNFFITELATLIPMCNAMNRKLDKLTVLRMAVQHMKTLRGEAEASTEVSQKPSFLSDEELKQLILQSAQGFLFVISCDRGRLLFVSESCKKVLNYKQSDLMGQSLFDYLHPKDIMKVKEQLLSSDVSPRERLIDAKTMTPVKTELPQKQTRLCPGARRSFVCRMKATFPQYNNNSSLDSDGYSLGDNLCRRRRTDRKNFVTIQCTGYIKSWSQSKLEADQTDAESDICNLSCLVAVGLPLPQYQTPNVSENPAITLRAIEFHSRQTLDAKFTYVDHRIATILGYLPQEMLGTSLYEYCHTNDVESISLTHKQVLKSRTKVESSAYRFKAKNGVFVYLKSKMFAFQNPWTNELECIVSTNTVTSNHEVSSSSMEVETQKPDCQPCKSKSSSVEMIQSMSHHTERETASPCMYQQESQGQKQVTSQIAAQAEKLGRQVMDEVMDTKCAGIDFRRQNLTSTDVRFCRLKYSAGIKLREKSPADVQSSSAIIPRKSEVAKAVRKTLKIAGMHHKGPRKRSVSSSLTDDNVFGMSLLEGDFLPPGMSSDNSTDSSSGTEGNEDVSMAMIMSLLEADGGLGGPVDFQNLPWPL